MNPLDDLLLIPDRIERIEALKNYARSLGLDIIQAKNSSGDYTEEKLVIMIFDALHNIKHENTRTYHLLSATVVLATIILTLMIIFPKIVASIYNSPAPITDQPSKTLRAYDKKGKPLLQDGQPVLFEYMDGVYQEFDERGRVKFEYLYKKGNLISKKEFDPHGQLISTRQYEDTLPAP